MRSFLIKYSPGLEKYKKFGIILLFMIPLLVMALIPEISQGKTYQEGDGYSCIEGFAGPYPCRNVDLLAHLPLAAMGAGEGIKGNDHWGWTDPQTERDFVIFGLTNGTAFIEITDRTQPRYLGSLPSHDGDSVWRDIKVYKDHAYITADIPGNHGLQVFDLTQLRQVDNPPRTFVETAHYDQFGPGHNLWINESSGFLYAFRTDTCNGEIHIVSLQDPHNPQFAGCFAVGDAPLSDSECVLYVGPDQAYAGREICFTGSDDNVSIGDVSDKNNSYIIADFKYPGIRRAHQGALTPNQRYWLLSDTMDEEIDGQQTRTYVFDVSDLEKPEVLGYYEHETTARDHNLYIKGAFAYETNWQAGLRILDLQQLPNIDFLETAFFDIVPGNDSIAASGAWSSFPWWADGVVTVSGTEEGLFILQPNLPRIHIPLIFKGAK